jgi:hypothetical protein
VVVGTNGFCGLIGPDDDPDDEDEDIRSDGAKSLVAIRTFDDASQSTIFGASGFILILK